jgi:hypothetical protein
MRLLLTGLLLLLSPLAGADYDTGARLYEDCKSENPFNQGYCGGYVTGVVATLVNLQRYRQLPDTALCIPDDVSKGQLVEAVVKYLENYPRQRDRQAVNLVPEALNAEYPCKA